MKHSNGQPTIFFKLVIPLISIGTLQCVMCRWPDIYSMKVMDKNFGIETATETVLFRMVGISLDVSNRVMLILMI